MSIRSQNSGIQITWRLVSLVNPLIHVCSVTSSEFDRHPVIGSMHRNTQHFESDRLNPVDLPEMAVFKKLNIFEAESRQTPWSEQPFSLNNRTLCDRQKPDKGHSSVNHCGKLRTHDALIDGQKCW